VQIAPLSHEGRAETPVFDHLHERGQTKNSLSLYGSVSCP